MSVQFIQSRLRLTEGARSAFLADFCLHRVWLTGSSKFNHKSLVLEQSLCYNDEFFLLCHGFHLLDSSMRSSSETGCAFIPKASIIRPLWYTDPVHQYYWNVCLLDCKPGGITLKIYLLESKSHQICVVNFRVICLCVILDILIGPSLICCQIGSTVFFIYYSIL